MEKPKSVVSENTRQEINLWKEELGRLAGEIRLQLHLGGMEAKASWERLEPKLEAFESSAERLTDEVVRELQGASTSLRQELQKLRDRLRQPQ